MSDRHIILNIIDEYKENLSSEIYLKLCDELKNSYENDNPDLFVKLLITRTSPRPGNKHDIIINNITEQSYCTISSDNYGTSGEKLNEIRNWIQNNNVPRNLHCYVNGLIRNTTNVIIKNRNITIEEELVVLKILPTTPTLEGLDKLRIVKALSTEPGTYNKLVLSS